MTDRRSADDIVVEFIQNFTKIPLDEAAHKELVRIIEAERVPASTAPVVDALCMALETAINSVECGSIDSNTGEELPWYKQAHEALRLAGRPWKGIRHE